jgi:predicted ester cyclase
MVHVRQRGRHIGEFLGIPPTGAEIDAEAMHVYRVEDGLLREHRAVRDDLTLLRALGVVSAPALAG